jgi:hypothetical protein
MFYVRVAILKVCFDILSLYIIFKFGVPCICYVSIFGFCRISNILLYFTCVHNIYLSCQDFYYSFSSVVLDKVVDLLVEWS